MHEERDKRDRTEQRHADEEDHCESPGDQRTLQQVDRQDRIGRTLLHSHERGQQEDRGREHPDGYLGAHAKRDQECADAGKQQAGTKPVDSHRPATECLWIRQHDDCHGEKAERQVEIEDPSPRQGVGDVPTHERARD